MRNRLDIATAQIFGFLNREKLASDSRTACPESCAAGKDVLQRRIKAIRRSALIAPKRILQRRSVTECRAASKVRGRSRNDRDRCS